MRKLLRAAARNVLLILDHRIHHSRFLGESRAQFFAVNFLRETEREAVTALEINAEHFVAAHEDAITQPDEDDGPGKDERRLRQLHEIQLGRA